MKRISYEPKHPETIVVEPNEWYSKGLTEKDVWNYYDKVKRDIVEFYEEYDLDTMIIIQTDGEVIKRPEAIRTVKDFDKWNTGRCLEFHFALKDKTPFVYCDLDPKEDFSFEDVKKIANELISKLEDWEEISEVRCVFSGSKGFHLYGYLKSTMLTGEAREQMKKLLNEYISERGDERLTTGVTKEANSMRLDTSTLHETGGLRVPGSLSMKTGLRCMEVPDILGFEKEKAKIDEVFKKFSKLEEYKEKRDFLVSPEPKPEEKAKKEKGMVFVIHDHYAKKAGRHFDLRLEKEGVLKSWTLPKAKLPGEGEKILAIQVEDHPYAYKDFEGTIPEGEYGAGEVKIEDKGTYDIIDWTDNKITFKLNGEKYTGTYVMIKINDNWLLMKKKEPVLKKAFEKFVDKGHFMVKLVEKEKAKMDMKFLTFEELANALGDKKIIISVKLDGEIVGVYFDGIQTIVATRAGTIRTDFLVTDEVTEICKKANIGKLIGFGELYTVDDKGIPQSYLKSQTILKKPRSLEDEEKIRLIIFDLKDVDGIDYTVKKYWDRVEEIKRIFGEGTTVTPAIFEFGTIEQINELWNKVLNFREYGYEGLVLTDPETEKRIKVKPLLTLDLVVVAVEKSETHPEWMGALLCSFMDKDKRFRLNGKVGTGFKQDERREWLDWANRNKVEEDEQFIWVDPFRDPRVVEVEAAEVNVRPTESFEFKEGWIYVEDKMSGVLRKPAFKRIREDKKVIPMDLRLEQIPGWEKNMKRILGIKRVADNLDLVEIFPWDQKERLVEKPKRHRLRFRNEPQGQDETMFEGVHGKGENTLFRGEGTDNPGTLDGPRSYAKVKKVKKIIPESIVTTPTLMDYDPQEEREVVDIQQNTFNQIQER
jgi:DNA ligase D-like protein (predicted 3'-phosphoesterase)